jgi:hypothetical protein
LARRRHGFLAFKVEPIPVRRTTAPSNATALRSRLDEAGYLRHQFRQAGVEVVYCNENLTGGDADDLVVGVKQWMAQRYVKDLSKVTLRGQITHSEAGAWCGGTPPYGFDLVYHDSTGRPYQHVRWLESGDKEVFDLDCRLTDGSSGRAAERQQA